LSAVNLRFVLCADDFGQTASVSAGILALLRAGRLSATSAMTNQPDWQQSAARLKELAGSADLGVHLNLTYGASLGVMSGLAPTGEFPPLGRVMRGALAGGLPLPEIADEFRRQIDAFARHMGREPDFLDGHQHVHAFPRIRRALLAAISALGLTGRLYVRDPADRFGAILKRRLCLGKALLIANLAQGFGRELAARQISTNIGFAGVSSFKARRGYAADFARFLTAPGSRHLVMCHPGLASADPAARDPIAATRPQEYDFLNGDAFPALLGRLGAALVRFRETKRN
jgi:predicted glycoside hydrolase/deacetylase ChbG (UPF0249 family)